MDPGNYLYREVFRDIWPACTIAQHYGCELTGDYVEAFLGYNWRACKNGAVRSDIIKDFVQRLERALISATALYFYHRVCAMTGNKFTMMKEAINHPKATPSSEARGGVWCQYPVDLEPSDEEPEHQSETSAAQSGGFQADEPEQQSESSSDESAEPLPKRRRPCSTSAESVLPPSAAGDIKVGQQIRALVARQCMLLKIHRDDPRSNANIAFDYLQLVRLRHKHVQRKQLNWEAPLSEEDIKNIWKEDLHQLFLDERPKNWTKTRSQLHSIFRVWLRESFGNVKAIRDILQNTCSWATWEEIELTQNLMTAV